MADKKMTCCASVAQHKRLRPQEDHSESLTSPHKDVSKRKLEELERGRTTEESVVKGKEVHVE